MSEENPQHFIGSSEACLQAKRVLAFKWLSDAEVEIELEIHIHNNIVED